MTIGTSAVISPTTTITANGETHERKEFDKMLKNIYYKQGYNSVNGNNSGPGIGSGHSNRKSFFDKRNNTEKQLNALVSDPNGLAPHHEPNHPSLSGLSEIGVNSAPQIGTHPDRGNIDS